MNILTDELPTIVKIGEKSYPINYDFRSCLRIILAFEDNELTAYEKQVVLIRNMFDRPPKDMEGAVKAAILFLNGGEESESDDASPHRLYSFSKDANLIFAAFRQTHGIDLDSAAIHWWKFLALFMDLGSDTAFCSLVSFRKRIKSGKATKEEKAAAREMGDLLNVPELDVRSIEEREAERKFMSLIKKASDGVSETTDNQNS